MTSLLRKSVLKSGASLTALFALVGTASAQDADADVGIEEIIVSAQKRDERLRDVPISITAYDQEFLDQIGVDDFGELSEITPGVNVQLQSPNNPSFVIRGITSDNGNFQEAPRITIYYNGVDVSRPRGSAFELFDLERIEVVKGPQATLFGTAAQIGAFSVISARPQEEFASEFYAGYGNFDYVKAGGFVTGGNDWIQGRLAAQWRSRTGFVDNVAGEPGSQSPTGPEGRDLNGLQSFSIRPSVRLTPSEDLTIDLIFTFERNDQPGTAFLAANIPVSAGADTDDDLVGELGGAFVNNLVSFGGLAFNPAIGGLAPVLTPVTDDDLANFLNGDELGLEREIYDINATVNYTINENWDFTSIIAYREFTSVELFDADGSQLPFLEISENTEGEQFNLETRFAYDYDWIRGFFGFNYFTEEGFQNIPTVLDETLFAACSDLATGAFNPAQCVNPDGSFNRISLVTGGLVPAGSAPGIFNETEFTNTGDFEVYSLFLDTTVKPTDKLELTAGVRFVIEEVESGISTVFTPSALIFLQLLEAGVLGPDQFNLAPPIQPTGVSTGGEFLTISDNFTDVLPRFNALYKFSDNFNVYGTISKGRKRPVISISNLDADLDGELDFTLLQEEIVWNFEAGFKTLFWGGRAELNASVFYQDYENFVVSVVQATDAGIINNSVDAGNATNVGVEVGSRAQVTDNLRIFGTFAWIDAEIDDDSSNGTFAGNTFRLTPEFSASAGFNWDHSLTDDYRVFLNGSWTWRSDVFFEEANVPIAGFEIGEGDVHQVDLRGGIRDAEDKWEIAGFVTNLTGEDFNIDGGNTGGGFGIPTFIPGEPRFYGIEFRVRY